MNSSTYTIGYSELYQQLMKSTKVVCPLFDEIKILTLDYHPVS